MPRATSRALLPFFNTLKEIAIDPTQPAPLRVEACRLCLALRTGDFAFLNKAATKLRKRETQKDPEATVEQAIDALLAQAEQERKENNGNETSTATNDSN